MRTLILKLLKHRCHSIHLRLLIGDNIGRKRKDFRLLARAGYGEKIVHHNQRAVVVLDHALEPEPIKLCDGALIMVDDLFSVPGAGQESEIFAFASDVVADQKAEMDRMAAMLEELQNESPH